MEAREVCFIIGEGDVVLWCDASDSPVAIPDARERWEAIWSRRELVVEIAHTHPLGGLHFSSTDEGTMEALDAALGRKLIYSVVTPDAMLRRTWPDPESHRDDTVENEPWWVPLLRVASGLNPMRKEK